MKKIISVILSVAMVLTCCGHFAYADSPVQAKEQPASTPETNAHFDDILRPLKNLNFSSLDAFTASLVKVMYGVVDFLIDNIVGILNFTVPSYDFNIAEDY